MSDYVTLIGAEDVKRAANTMRDAARAIQDAACTIEEALRRHERVMDELVFRIEEAAKEPSDE
jgi:hypothetical protein